MLINPLSPVREHGAGGNTPSSPGIKKKTIILFDKGE